MQWWKHSPPTNVARVWFPDLTPYVGWVCCWFSILCSERFFSAYSGFPLSPKTNISKFWFDPDAGPPWKPLRSECSFLGKYHDWLINWLIEPYLPPYGVSPGRSKWDILLPINSPLCSWECGTCNSVMRPFKVEVCHSSYLFSRWVPESCRWLVVNNRTIEAERVFLSIAALNKTKLSTDELALEMNEESAVKEGGILDLVCTRKQLVKTLTLWFAW